MKLYFVQIFSLIVGADRTKNISVINSNTNSANKVVEFEYGADKKDFLAK